MPKPEQRDATGLGEALDPFDRAGLAAIAGALQLVPQNANRLLRLYGFAGTAASLPARTGLPRISTGRLRAYLNGPPLATSEFVLAEDPFDNPFADEVSFHGGPYLVFPSVDDDSSYVFRHLAKAIFSSPTPYIQPRFVEEARALCTSVLTVSHEIAERAGVDRFDEPAGATPNPVLMSPERLGRAIEASGAPLDEAYATAYGQLRALVAPSGDVVVPAAASTPSTRRGSCVPPSVRRSPAGSRGRTTRANAR